MAHVLTSFSAQMSETPSQRSALQTAPSLPLSPYLASLLYESPSDMVRIYGFIIINIIIALFPTAA